MTPAEFPDRADVGRPDAGEAFPQPTSRMPELRELLQRLAGSNLRSVRLARQLMILQDVADRHRTMLHGSIEAAAASRDPLAIEDAVMSTATADLAEEAEWELRREWNEQIEDVHRLIAEVEGVLGAPLVAG